MWHMATERVISSCHLKCDRNRISEVTFEVGQPFVFLSSSRWLMWTMEKGATDESGNLPHPNMVMDDQNAIKKAFNARAITVRRSKGHNSS